jgi:hypothetical protein
LHSQAIEQPPLYGVYSIRTKAGTSAKAGYSLVTLNGAITAKPSWFVHAENIDSINAKLSAFLKCS